MKSSASERGLAMLIKKRISKTCQNKGASTTFIVDKIIGKSVHNPEIARCGSIYHRCCSI